MPSNDRHARLPGRVRVGRDPVTGWKVYEVDGDRAMVDAGYGGEMVHIPNLTMDGLRGLS